MRQRLYGTITAAAFIGLSIWAPANAQIQWDLPQAFGASDQAGVAAEYFAEKVSEKTNGEIQITVHHAGALGYDCADHFELVESGALPVASICTSFASGYSPIFKIVTLPFLVQKPEHARLLHEAANAVWDGVLREHGQFELAATPNTPSGIWASEAIDSVTKLQNFKLRTYDPNGLATFQAIGAAPVNMSFGDVLPALSTGTIDGVLTGADAGLSSGFNDYLDHFIEINFAIPWNTITINNEIFESLSPEHQQAVLEAGRETNEMSWSRMETTLLGDSRKKMRDSGVTVIEQPPQEFLDALQEAGRPIWGEWVAEMGAPGEEIISTYQSLVEQN